MSQLSPFRIRTDAAAIPQPLSVRVATCVSEARLVLDRRDSVAADLRSPPSPDPLAARVTRTPDQVREARSLRRVFLQLRDRYDDYRARSGSPESPAVRDAASCFRRQLSFAALLAYAGRLEELDILV
jgi:hypothetical protein